MFKGKKGIYVVIVIINFFIVVINNNGIGFSLELEENSLVKLDDGNKNKQIDIGEIVRIGQEKFYVVDSNNDETVLLSYYNLDLNLNKQSSESLGEKFLEYNNDTISFEDSFHYLEEYKKILNKFILVDDVSLISREDLEFLGIEENSYMSMNYENIYNTSYWVSGVDKPYYVSSSSYYGEYFSDFGEDFEYGIRPLVKVSKSVSDGLNLVLDNNDNGEIDVWDVVEVGKEKFYCIGNDSSLILFSVYNLNLRTNLQSEDSLGYVLKRVNNGTVAVISDKKKGDYSLYEGSNLEDYIKKYKFYLFKEYGLEGLDISLMNEDYLVNLGCSLYDNTCVKADDWVFKTSYWVDYRSCEDEVWAVNSNGEFSSNSYDNSEQFGVRPLVFIETKQIKVG